MDEYPVGFGLTLAMNGKALENFSAMSEDKKQEILGHTHHIRSKEEMQAFVQSIADGKQNPKG